MKPLLVLGATGFIGRQVAARASGWEVVTASRREGAADLWLDPLVPESLAELLRVVSPAVVVNCSGAVTGSASEMVEGNVTAVANLVNAIRARGCRLVHLGSAAEYGAVPVGVPVAEGCPPRPVGTYGVTKLAGTSLVLGAPDSVVLRVFNPFGAGSPRASLLGEVAAQMAAGVLEIRTGSLSAVRDYVDVRDVADAALAAARSDVRGVLNVGHGEATVSRDLVQELVSFVPGTRLAERESGSERSAAVPWQQADIGAIGAALGWQPSFSLSDAVRALWESAQVERAQWEPAC